MVHGDIWKGSTRYCNYLEDYWCGISAAKVISMQLRDLINSGRRHKNREESCE